MWDIQNNESHSAGRLQLLTVQNPNYQIRFLTHHESFARPKIVPPACHKYLYVHFMLISLWTPEHLAPKPCAESNTDVWLWGLPGGPGHLKGVGWGSGPNSVQAGQVFPLKPEKTISQMDIVMLKHKRWHWNVTGPTHCGQVCESLSPCLYHNMIYLLFITNFTVCSMLGGKIDGPWRQMKCWNSEVKWWFQRKCGEFIRTMKSLKHPAEMTSGRCAAVGQRTRSQALNVWIYWLNI